ncbi:MAG: penicillin-insensitive murein endopeptidase, partial [Pseudomonadota bacterium]
AVMLACAANPAFADQIAEKIKKDARAQAVEAIEKTPAKKLFGYQPEAAKLKARAIGFYSRGCLAGGQRLEPTGPAWQAMRLSRNRNWGHPVLISMIKKLAVEAKEKDGWPGLLVGDLTQPRGGPMLTGHASHQVGLDADVWLKPMPNKHLSYEEREKISAVSMLKNRLDVNPKTFTEKTVRLIKRAASYPEVSRVGVNPAIKAALCRANGGDAPWLRKVQGWRGHHYHMHIRLKCPPGSKGAGCKDQGPPGNTSCAFAEKWYAKTKAAMENPKPRKKGPKKPVKKRKPKPEMLLAGLPKACRSVLTAPSAGGMSDAIVVPEAKPDLFRRTASQGRKLLRESQ